LSSALLALGAHTRVLANLRPAALLAVRSPLSVHIYSSSIALHALGAKTTVLANLRSVTLLARSIAVSDVYTYSRVRLASRAVSCPLKLFGGKRVRKTNDVLEVDGGQFGGHSSGFPQAGFSSPLSILFCAHGGSKRPNRAALHLTKLFFEP